jgi:hypothetical protein
VWNIVKGEALRVWFTVNGAVTVIVFSVSADFTGETLLIAPVDQPVEIIVDTVEAILVA